MTSGQAFKYCNVHTELHACVGQPVFTSHTAVLLQNNLHREGRQTAQRRHKEEAAPPSAGRPTGSWRHDRAETNEMVLRRPGKQRGRCCPGQEGQRQHGSEEKITEGSSFASALPLTTALIIVDHCRRIHRPDNEHQHGAHQHVFEHTRHRNANPACP